MCHGPPSLSEFPTIEQSLATARSADQPTTRGNPDWATLASTPIVHSNRFARLSTEEDEQSDAVTDQWAYIQVSRRKNKRPRNRGSPQPASDVVQDGAAANSRREPTVLGRSRISASKVVAAKPIRKKSIFFASTTWEPARLTTLLHTLPRNCQLRCFHVLRPDLGDDDKTESMSSQGKRSDFVSVRTIVHVCWTLLFGQTRS